MAPLCPSGGSGKTRLALQVATSLVEEFEHGVWWVELAALSDPLLVPQAVASALGIPERANCILTEALADVLRPRHLLLVLDNGEHLLAACAQLIETLLRACPQLRVLVTSRAALTITGETVWLVLPLRVPDTYQLPPIEGLLAYEAVELFIERARSVRSSLIDKSLVLVEQRSGEARYRMLATIRQYGQRYWSHFNRQVLNVQRAPVSCHVV